MTTNRFGHYVLRTTDVDQARTFYPTVLGSDFWGPDIALALLPAAAAARGAPAHWLGVIGTSDVDHMAARIVVAGGQRLGLTDQGGERRSSTVLRDPFGVVMALSAEAIRPSRDLVHWHLMHTHDHERAFALYSSLFGWTAREALDLGPEMGRHQLFSWDRSGPSVGSVANTARLPHIHPQWLFFFRVDDLDRSMARVEVGGGLVVGPMRTASGDLVAPCDDPQGAAFGLYQSIRQAS